MDSEEEHELILAEEEGESLKGSDQEDGDDNDWESYDGFLVEELSASEIDDAIEGENQGKESKLAR